MKNINKIFLPGGLEQFKLLRYALPLEGLNILVMGANSENLALKLAQESQKNVDLIVEDYNTLLNSKMLLAGEENIRIRLMAYDSTDFETGEFDVVFAQAAVSSSSLRNKIVKEIKRILKPEGYLCVGESVNLTEEVPVFVADIWERADITPHFSTKMEAYYSERGFKVIAAKDLSSTLKEYYLQSAHALEKQLPLLSENEKVYYKKLLKRISHETKAYLSQGGDKYIGFRALILQKYKPEMN